MVGTCTRSSRAPRTILRPNHRRSGTGRDCDDGDYDDGDDRDIWLEYGGFKYDEDGDYNYNVDKAVELLMTIMYATWWTTW